MRIVKREVLAMKLSQVAREVGALQAPRQAVFTVLGRREMIHFDLVKVDLSQELKLETYQNA